MGLSLVVEVVDVVVMTDVVIGVDGVNEFEKPFTLEEAYELLKGAEGVEIYEGSFKRARRNHSFPVAHDLEWNTALFRLQQSNLVKLLYWNRLW